MILKRFYDDSLAQASYLVGCAATGEAIVIDPNRDVDQYIAAAAAEDLRVTAVTETHIHADYASGSRELAARAGARLYLSDEGDTRWKYAFAADAGATLLKDGHTIRLGNLRLQAIHTPGHTPEHLSFLLTDTPATDRPIGVFTGDFVFVGDVGRPDLLERAAGEAGSAEAGARALFRSLRRFKALPDYLQVWPAHGAGSACGKGLSAVPQSTVGYEKLANWALLIEDEAEFVRAVRAGQPDAPVYFAQMKRINREGPPLLGGPPTPPRLPASRLAEILRSGALVVDTRPAASFAAGHVPGTLNIPLNRSFVTWAGWLLPYDRPFYLLTDEGCPDCLGRAARDLALIGLDRVAGSFDSEALEDWAAFEGPLASVPHVTPEELEALRAAGRVAVLDVRSAAEWEASHIPGVPNIPLGALPARLDEVPRERPLVVHCQSGARSAIAAGLLLARGLPRVSNLSGGFAAWRERGLPTAADRRTTLDGVLAA